MKIEGGGGRIMNLLTRKQAAMMVAIPQQMKFMIGNDYPPTWEIFSRSTAWLQTIDNLQLSKAEQDDYRDRWNRILNLTIKGLH